MAKATVSNPRFVKYDCPGYFPEPPPPGLDECELAKWALAREQRLLQDRLAWDAKWAPGAHATANGQSLRAIENKKKKVKEKCKNDC